MGKTVSLSVVVVIGAERRRALLMLDTLQQQSAADRLEAVLVDMSPESDPVVLPTGNLRTSVIRTAVDISWDKALLAGFNAASAPAVALLEDHCLPENDWAACVIEAHQKGWAVVGYAFSNGSPDTWLYRSIFMAEYGFWAVPATSGPAKTLPGNNLSYDRNALLSLGEISAEGLSDVDTILGRMSSKGLFTGVEPRARVAHQSSGLREVLHGHYSLARLSAAARYKDCSWFLRAAVAVAAPLVFPVLRAWRLFRSLNGRPGLRKQFLAAMPIVFLIYQFAAFGVAAGCLLGEGVSPEDFERAQLNAPRNRAGSSK